MPFHRILCPIDFSPVSEHALRVAARLAKRDGRVLVLHGPFLAHPAVRPRLERLVHLAVDEATCLKRLAGRDARAQGMDALVALRRHLLPKSRSFEAEFPPAEHADLVLAAQNPLGP